MFYFYKLYPLLYLNRSTCWEEDIINFLQQARHFPQPPQPHSSPVVHYLTPPNDLDIPDLQPSTPLYPVFPFCWNPCFYPYISNLLWYFRNHNPQPSYYSPPLHLTLTGGISDTLIQTLISIQALTESLPGHVAIDFIQLLKFYTLLAEQAIYQHNRLLPHFPC